jgi:hypothetical protein
MSSSTCRVSGGSVPGGSGDLQRPNATPICNTQFGGVLEGGVPRLCPDGRPSSSLDVRFLTILAERAVLVLVLEGYNGRQGRE